MVADSEVIAEPSFLDRGSAPALLRLAVQKRRSVPEGDFGATREDFTSPSSALPVQMTDTKETS